MSGSAPTTVGCAGGGASGVWDEGNPPDRSISREPAAGAFGEEGRCAGTPAMVAGGVSGASGAEGTRFELAKISFARREIR